jgi:hypothetical protein
MTVHVQVETQIVNPSLVDTMPVVQAAEMGHTPEAKAYAQEIGHTAIGDKLPVTGGGMEHDGETPMPAGSADSILHDMFRKARPL